MNGTESDICDGTNVCSAIKALESKLEAKLENLFKLVSPLGKPLLQFVCFFFFFFYLKRLSWV